MPIAHTLSLYHFTYTPSLSLYIHTLSLSLYKYIHTLSLYLSKYTHSFYLPTYTLSLALYIHTLSLYLYAYTHTHTHTHTHTLSLLSPCLSTTFQVLQFSDSFWNICFFVEDWMPLSQTQYVLLYATYKEIESDSVCV